MSTTTEVKILVTITKVQQFCCSTSKDFFGSVLTEKLSLGLPKSWPKILTVAPDLEI